MSKGGDQERLSGARDDFELLIGESHEIRERPVIKGRIQVLVTNKALSEVEEYAAGDQKYERGGFLLGRCFGKRKQAVVSIEAWIAAKYATHRKASITFTHRDWEYMAMEHERLYPNLRVVGWFHTHPGYGVFLSSYDLFIQKNFFSDEYQVALVIDPVEKQRGIFLWENSEIVKGEYQVIQEKQDEDPDTHEEDQESNKTRKERGRPQKAVYGKAVLLAMILLLLICAGLLHCSRRRIQREYAGEGSRGELNLIRREF